MAFFLKLGLGIFFIGLSGAWAEQTGFLHLDQRPIYWRIVRADSSRKVDTKPFEEAVHRMMTDQDDPDRRLFRTSRKGVFYVWRPKDRSLKRSALTIAFFQDREAEEPFEDDEKKELEKRLAVRIEKRLPKRRLGLRVVGRAINAKKSPKLTKLPKECEGFEFRWEKKGEELHIVQDGEEKVIVVKPKSVWCHEDTVGVIAKKVQKKKAWLDEDSDLVDDLDLVKEEGRYLKSKKDIHLFWLFDQGELLRILRSYETRAEFAMVRPVVYKDDAGYALYAKRGPTWTRNRVIVGVDGDVLLHKQERKDLPSTKEFITR